MSCRNLQVFVTSVPGIVCLVTRIFNVSSATINLSCIKVNALIVPLDVILVPIPAVVSNVELDFILSVMVVLSVLLDAVNVGLTSNFIVLHVWVDITLPAPLAPNVAVLAVTVQLLMHARLVLRDFGSM